MGASSESGGMHPSGIAARLLEGWKEKPIPAMRLWQAKSTHPEESAAASSDGSLASASAPS